MNRKNFPTILVIFGATGDLMGKKIVPALFHLYKKNKLPPLFQVLGVARRPFTHAEFRENVSALLAKHDEAHLTDASLAGFTRCFFYEQGDFRETDSYRSLARVMGRIDGEWKVCANKLFYLAVPPQYYETIFHQLASSGLTLPCSPAEGWTRVIVEKPFGHDLTTAEKLDLLLAKLFKEEQIYRIDHYLAKEMLQNILSFRFSNNLLEQSWNNKNIERIDIRLLEKIGVEGRGGFYDPVGALRDVGQNHLLQMLALITMEQPKVMNAKEVRYLRARLLQDLRLPGMKEAIAESFRGQYVGYDRIEGVKKDSQTETYFKIKAHLDSPRWQGVPIFMESGKRMKKQLKEIMVTFKHVTPCLCPPGKHYKNKVVFQLEPEERIQICFLSKKPGLEMEIEDRSLDFVYRSTVKRRQYVEEYEKLLLDCIEGNQLLFVSTAEVKEMWAYVDPILRAWRESKVPLVHYQPDTAVIRKDATRQIEASVPIRPLKKELVVIGLGKMGGNLVRNLLNKNWKVAGYNRSSEDTKLLERQGMIGIYDLKEIRRAIARPRIVWLMLPAGKTVDEVIFSKGGLISLLDKGDIIVDAGNSFYQDAVVRSQKLQKSGIDFADVGFSGGPGGAQSGACLMVGGDKKLFEYLLPLYTDMAVVQGVAFFAGAGAGHFVKMIHNGIEYGMMQAIAEGFTVLKESAYKLDLQQAAEVYNHGSVVESRLIGWLADGLARYGVELEQISSTVRHTGEGEWTVKTAKKMGLKTQVIDVALKFRQQSEKNPSYTGKILSTLRNMFGGHTTK